MTRMKFISSFIQRNVAIFFKLTIWIFVPLHVNFKGWFHSLTMQTGQNKKTRRVTHTDVDPYKIIDPLPQEVGNIICFFYLIKYNCIWNKNIWPTEIYMYILLYKKTLYYICCFLGKRVNHGIGVNICMRYPVSYFSVLRNIQKSK